MRPVASITMVVHDDAARHRARWVYLRSLGPAPRDAGDDVSIVAGARAGQKFGENVTLEQILAEVRAAVPDYLALMPGSPTLDEVGQRKVVARSKVPR